LTQITDSHSFDKAERGGVVVRGVDGELWIPRCYCAGFGIGRLLGSRPRARSTAGEKSLGLGCVLLTCNLGGRCSYCCPVRQYIMLLFFFLVEIPPIPTIDAKSLRFGDQVLVVNCSVLEETLSYCIWRTWCIWGRRN